MTPTVIALMVILFAAIVTAALALVSVLERRDVLMRATETGGAPVPQLLRPERPSDSRIDEWLKRLASSREPQPAIQSKLVRAGIESPTASAVYWVLRTVSLGAFPALAWALLWSASPVLVVLVMGISIFLGWIFPMAMLDRLVRKRQERIRRSVPDALDLLVVCVEAGISLDAAIIRVSRDIRLLHPDLALELSVVNRVTNAGIPRDVALRGLYERTGVPELRSLVSSLVQSEKWGTSIATVLRVSSDTLRRKRRQAAQKAANQAPLKMTFPLLLLILPPLFVVILGPAVIRISEEFSKL
ncbi:MAG: type II secretion system F family protein [Gemmatimonadaceae bacterium]|nr:type II secretion system F family protein [Gemmatimonadaceae bacterium]